MTGARSPRPGRPVRVAVVIARLEGGAGVLALRGAAALDPDLFVVTVVAGRGSPRLLAAAADHHLEIIPQPALRTPIDPARDLRALHALRTLFRDRRFDVVHTHTAKAGTLGRLAARHAGAPRIVHTYHGFPFHEFQSPVRRGSYLAIERRLGRITDLALCVGTGVSVEAVRRRVIAPERIRTIGVAVEPAEPVLPPTGHTGTPHSPAGLPARTSGARQRARRLLGLPNDAVVIGAVGRLTYQKAPEDFLTAIRLLDRPGVTGVWVGDGELADRVRALANAGQGPPVILAGDRVDVPALLPAFDLFALSSRYEGLPTVVVEAMMCGIPVVATAVNAVSDVVVPGETGLLVPPQRPDLMAAALRHLLDSPALATRMAERARIRLGDRFGVPALREALIDAYVG